MYTQFHTEFNNRYGTRWKAEILDMIATTGINTQLTASRPGIELKYNREITDSFKGGIIRSSVSLYLINNNNVYLTWLKGKFQTASEGDYILRLSKWNGTAYDFYWAGPILNDFSALSDIQPGEIIMRAVDGLALLKETEFTTQNNFLAYFQAAIQSMHGFSDIFHHLDYLKTLIEWRDDRIASGVDPLSCIRVDEAVLIKYEEKKGYRGTITKEIRLKWFDLLTTILQHMNLNMILIRGAWLLVPLYALDYKGNKTFYTYNEDGTSFTKSISFAATVSTRHSEQVRFLPGLKNVRTDYHSFDGGNLLPTTDSLTFAVTYNLRTVTAGTGNYIHIRGIFTGSAKFDSTINNPNSGSDVRDSAYFKLTIKVGSSYWVNTAPNQAGSWSTTSGYYYLQGIMVVGVANSKKNSLASFDFFTDALPTGSNIYTIKAEIDTSRGLVTQPDVVSITYSIDPWQTYFIVNDEKPAEFVTLLAVNPSNFSLTNTIPDTPFGTSGGTMSKGRLETYNGTDWQYSSGKWSTTPGVSGTTYMHFNQLCVHELLKLQSNPIFILDTSFPLNSTYIDILNTLTIVYGGDTYQLIGNNITYKDDLLVGDFIAISKTAATLSISDTTISSSQSTLGTNNGFIKMQHLIDENAENIGITGTISVDGTVTLLGVSATSTDPHVKGQLWNADGTIKISSG